MFIWVIRLQDPLFCLRLCFIVCAPGILITHTLHLAEWASCLTKLRHLLLNRGWINRPHSWLAHFIRDETMVPLEEILRSPRTNVELESVVFWCIEEFFESFVSMDIVFWVFNVEVWDPAKLAEHVSMLADSSVVWHSCPFNFVLLVWVQWTTRLNSDGLPLTKWFIEVFLQKKLWELELMGLPWNSSYFMNWRMMDWYDVWSSNQNQRDDHRLFSSSRCDPWWSGDLDGLCTLPHQWRILIEPSCLLMVFCLYCQ